ncbi:MAG TPA: tetratricopeptide repeat protein [Polyangiaceae bacterium]|jgi:hypothetical protein
MSSKIVASLLVALVAFEAGAARAQTTSSDSAIAQSLFDEGRKLMNAKRYAEACPRLERSYKLDPATGTLLNLAVCHEKVGKTATAWDEFRDTIAMARRENREDRVRFAQAHFDALKERVCTLTVRHATREPGLELKLDGIKLGPESLGLALPIDPGAHTLEANAPDYKSWSTSVELRRDGQAETLDIPELAAVPKPKPLPPLLTVQVVPPPRSRGVSAWIALPITAGVLGFGAMALGGVESLSAWHDRTAACGIGGDANACTQAGIDADANARRWALVADIGLGVGVAGAIGTLVVALVSRGSSKEAPAHVAISPFGVGVVGTF